MEKQDENIENNSSKIINTKTNFFKKLWNSITKIELYPDMSADGVGKAITYISKLVAILAIVLSLGIVFQANKNIKEGINYIEKELPEFSFEDGILSMEQKEEITAENDILGKVIIDTNVDTDPEVNKYINSISDENGNGILILKDKAILVNYQGSGTSNYSYKDSFNELGLDKFSKQDLLNYLKSNKMIEFYVGMFIVLFIYAFILYLLTTLANALILSIFGYLTTFAIRMKMRFAAIFNMAVYALTLSTILNILYIIVNYIFGFSMEYFQVMYTSVAGIYLIAALFLLKSDMIKLQQELMKVEENEKQENNTETEIPEEEKEEKENKDNKEKNEKDKDDEKEKNKEEKHRKNDGKDNNLGNEVEGSNA